MGYISKHWKYPGEMESTGNSWLGFFKWHWYLYHEIYLYYENNTVPVLVFINQNYIVCSYLTLDGGCVTVEEL